MPLIVRRSFLCGSRRSLAELVNPLGCIGLRKGLVEFFVGLPTQCLQIGALWVRHRFIASLPLVGISQQRRLVCIIHSWSEMFLERAERLDAVMR